MSSSRQVCPHCLRAAKACICHCVKAVNNHVCIGLFQHSSERLQTKGTARLCCMNLQNSILWSGEDLATARLELIEQGVRSELGLRELGGSKQDTRQQIIEPREIEDSLGSQPEALLDWLHSKPTYLLYPPTEEGASHEVIAAEELAKSLCTSRAPKTPLAVNQDFQVLVLDGTWKKTHKLLMLNPELQALPRILISPTTASSYVIRKQKDHASLSTIEAVAELLEVLEPKMSIQNQLNESFACMQNFLLSLRVNADS